MILSLLHAGQFNKVINYTVAGFGDVINSDIVDMDGYENALIVCALGDVAATAVATLKAYTGDAAALGDGAYEGVVAGGLTATATDHDQKLLILDVIKPGKRYLRADVARATANIVIDAVLVILYNGKNIPAVQGADVIDSDVNVN